MLGYFYLLKFCLPPVAFFVIYTIVAYLEAFLNIYKFRIPKLTGKSLYIGVSIAAALALILYVVLL